MVAALATLAGAAKQRAASDCFVTSTWPDGRVEERECIVKDGSEKAPTKGRFESCTR